MKVCIPGKKYDEFIFIYLFNHLNIYKSIYLSIYLHIYLFFLSIYLTIYLSLNETLKFEYRKKDDEYFINQKIIRNHPLFLQDGFGSLK